MVDVYRRINELLPSTHRLDVTYLDVIVKMRHGASTDLQKHVALDRLEARLRTLDKKRGEEVVRVWEETWATSLLETPEFAGFRKPYSASNTQQRKSIVVS